MTIIDMIIPCKTLQWARDKSRLKFISELQWLKWLICQCHRYFVSLPMETNAMHCNGALAICFQSDVLQIIWISFVASNTSHFVSSFIICTAAPARKTREFLQNWNTFENIIIIEHLIKIASELLITNLGLFTISGFM